MINITFRKQQPNTCLKCNAYGNPDHYIFSEWEHRTEYGDHIRFLNDSGSGYIELKSTSREAVRLHDQGIYICSVSNGIIYDGKITQVATFTLEQKGITHLIFFNI